MIGALHTSALSPGEMARAQRRFYWFSAFNSLSFGLLSGNLITLYTIRLGASPFLIGLLASFIPMAQLLPAVGRFLVPRMGITRLMGTFWLIQYLAMIPLLFAPAVYTAGNPAGALAICVVCVAGFNGARGIGLTANQPLFGSLVREDEVGTFLARMMLVVQICSVAVGIAMALVLGHDAPLSTYSLLMAAGIVLGILGALTIFRLPEPRVITPSGGGGVAANLLARLHDQKFRRYMIVVMVGAFFMAMAAPFLIVFVKDVYEQPDGNVIYFVVIGSLGAILVSVLSGFLTDRVGAKPLYFVYTAVMTLALIPMAWAPVVDNTIVFWVYAGLIFLLFNLGIIGTAVTGQVYFFALIREKDRLNLGIVYFIAGGAAAAMGSIAGGAALERLGPLFSDPTDAYRVYFGGLVVAFTLILVLIARLHSLGAYSIRSVFAIIFSPRDLRVIGLLHKLRKSRTQPQERRFIRQLGQTPSKVSTDDLVRKLQSPRFTIRSEALAALRDHPLDQAFEDVLISEVKNHHFTTAYIAAEILGLRNVSRGVGVLRQAVGSGDPFLAGKAMVALARLDDRDFIPQIEERLEQASNPRLIIHAALALEILREVPSIPLLLRKLEKRTSPFVRDEIILAVAAILGIDDFFHPLYNTFLASERDGVAALTDVIKETKSIRQGAPDADALVDLVETKESGDFAIKVADVLSGCGIRCDDRPLADLLLPAVRHEVIGKLERFAYLIKVVLIWNFCVDRRRS